MHSRHLSVPRSLTAEIDHLPRQSGRVPAHVVAKQMMPKVKIAGTANDLFRHRHIISRMDGIKYSIGSVLTEIGRGSMVRGWPYPQRFPISTAG